MTRSERAEECLEVWVVEDERVMLSGLCALMRAHGIEAYGFGDPRDALQRALQKPPRILVTDLLMPEMSGVELARALRDRLGGECPRLFLVTGAEPRRVELTLFDHVVRKPFRFAALLPHLVTHLGSRELRRPNARERIAPRVRGRMA